MAATALDVADAGARPGHRSHRRRPALGQAARPGAARRSPRGYKLVVTIEDNGRTGGCGSAVAQLLRDAAVDVPLCDFALPQQFLPHGRRDEMLAEAGLSAQELARRVIEAVARREPGLVANRTLSSTSTATSAGTRRRALTDSGSCPVRPQR